MMTCCLLVVGALCLAHSLADLGEANIIAIVHDTGLDSGVGGISAINHFYGRPDIPIGAYRGPVGRPSTSEKPAWVHKGRGVYVDDLVASFPVGGVRTAKDVPSALEVYRSVLGAAPDRSVTVVSIVRPPHARRICSRRPLPLLQPSRVIVKSLWSYCRLCQRTRHNHIPLSVSASALAFPLCALASHPSTSASMPFPSARSLPTPAHPPPCPFLLRAPTASHPRLRLLASAHRASSRTSSTFCTLQPTPYQSSLANSSSPRRSIGWS